MIDDVDAEDDEDGHGDDDGGHLGVGLSPTTKFNIQGRRGQLVVEVGNSLIEIGTTLINFYHQGIALATGSLLLEAVETRIKLYKWLWCW